MMNEAYPLINAVSAPTAIVGTTGAGKTFAAKGVAEQLLDDGRRVVVIDPTGAWWGLRSGADGNPAGGYQVTIFGGDHADIPISADHGSTLAAAIARREVQAIIDTSEMTGGEKIRFLTDFLETLYARNKAALYLIVDEADEVCPQNPMPEQRRLSGAFDKIVRRGRIKGFRPLMITQRPAVLHKNVLSQIGTLIALKLTSPQDRKAIDDWVKGNADGDQAKEVMSSLPTLARGEGWLWSPAADVLERRQFPTIRTFDSSRTPELNEAIVEPALSPVDVATLREAMSQADATDKAGNRTAVDDTAIAAAERRGYDRGLAEGIERGKAAGIALGLTRARDAIDTLRIPDIAASATEAARSAPDEPPEAIVPKAAKPARNTATIGDDGALTEPQQRIVRSLTLWRSLGHTAPSRVMVAVAAGYTPTSGNFGNLLGQLRSRGVISYPSAGDVRLEGPELPLEGSACGLLLSILSAPQTRIFEALTGAEQTREEIAAAAGYSPTSGNFGNLLGGLRSLGIITYPATGKVQLSPWAQELVKARNSDA